MEFDLVLCLRCHTHCFVHCSRKGLGKSTNMGSFYKYYHVIFCPSVFRLYLNYVSIMHICYHFWPPITRGVVLSLRFPVSLFQFQNIFTCTDFRIIWHIHFCRLEQSYQRGGICFLKFSNNLSGLFSPVSLLILMVNFKRTELCPLKGLEVPCFATRIFAGPGYGNFPVIIYYAA